MHAVLILQTLLMKNNRWVVGSDRVFNTVTSVIVFFYFINFMFAKKISFNFFSSTMSVYFSCRS